jgi:protein HIRA/HIR1
MLSNLSGSLTLVPSPLISFCSTIPNATNRVFLGELRDCEVYSCHVSADGKRLVTAAGDSHVRIWSTEAIFKSNDPNYDGPKQLAHISTHSGTIHVVRFSGNNKYIASGADDKIVCIYGLDPNPPTLTKAFGSNDAPPVENWRVLRRLVGHDNDVQDLAWSYDSSILVSVGLDSKVVIWSGHTFEKLKTLSQHQSHVKGITFDPANKYFATASDDRTIKVFRFTSPPPNATAHDQVGNFTLEATISEPFTSSPLTTYFRRCSWSPDGMHIAAANAVNGPVPSVAIVSRGTWESSINFIGHEGPVEVCAFCPRMFYKEKPTIDSTDESGNPHSPVTVIACGGQDKALSIWNTRLTRPFVITQAIASKAISDLAWSPDGEKLFVTTLDGAILTVIFEEGELGFVAPEKENERALSRYGAGRKAGIVEGTEAMILEELSKADEIKGVEGRMGELMGDGAVTQPSVNGTSGDHAQTNGTAATAAATTTTTTNGTSTPDPQEVKITQLKQRVEIVGGKKRVKPLLISSATAPTSSLPQTQLVTNAAQGVKGPNDSPHAILDLSKPYDGLPKGGLTGLLIGNKRKFAEIAGDDEHRTEKRVQALVKDGAAPALVNTADGVAPPGPRDKGDMPSVPSVLVPHVVDPALTVSNVRLATPLLRSVIVRTLDGSEPPKEGEPGGEILLLEARNATGPPRTGHTGDRDPTRINCIRAGLSVWQDFVAKPVLLLTGNHHFWAAGCDDGTLHVWTPAGRRLLNALVLESQPVIMDCRGWWLLCITAVGQIRIWNIETLKSPHPPVSVAPILDAAVRSQGPHLLGTPGIAFARLNSEGRVIVAMTNGDGYTYSPDMFVWQRLAEPWFAIGSQYWNTTDSSSVGIVQSTGTATGTTTSTTTSAGATKTGAAAAPEPDMDFIAPENLSAGILPLLERNTTQQIQLRGRAYMLQRLHKALLVAEGFEGFEASVSVAHLENRMAGAMALGARDEFRVYLLMYAKRIGAEGLRFKVEELMRMLLGDVFEKEPFNKILRENPVTGGRNWHTESGLICGWSRLELLKEVVLILGMFCSHIALVKTRLNSNYLIGKNRDIQRLTVPYARILGLVKEGAAASTADQDAVMQDEGSTATLGFVSSLPF